MMSLDLDMDEIFDEAPPDDDDAGAGQNEAGGGDENEAGADDTQPELSEDVLSKLKDISGAAKKKVMKPQPKLNAAATEERKGTACSATDI